MAKASTVAKTETPANAEAGTGGRSPKPLEELTLMDDYMFSAVMQDVGLLGTLLERVLSVKISSVEFAEDHAGMKSGYRSHAVQLDLYVRDADGRVFNVEVQVEDRHNLPRRMRYYQSAADVTLLSPGADYRELRDAAVVFICAFDPFGRGRCLYTFRNECLEEPGLPLGDGTLKAVVNVSGDRAGVPADLAELALYLHTGEATGDYTTRLDEAVRRVKASEERRHEYMVGWIHDMEVREEGREAGREEGREAGREEGAEKQRLQSIASVMDSLGVGPEDAMGILKVPEADRGRYLEMLQVPEPA